MPHPAAKKPAGMMNGVSSLFLFEWEGDEMHAILFSILLVVAPQEKAQATYQGQPAGYWMKILHDRQHDVRQEAIRALGRIGDDAVPELVKAFEAEDASVRSAAASAIRGRADQAVPALTKLLVDKEGDHRHSDAGATYDGETIESWQKLLDDKDRQTKQTAKNAVRDLSRRPFLSPRASAAEALGRYGASAVSAKSSLIACLKDEDVQIRWRCARALGQIDLTDAEVFAALVAAHGTTDHTWTREEFGKVRSSTNDEVFEIIARMRDGATTPLMEALKHQDDSVRRNAAVLLGRIGSYATPSVPALTKATKDPSPDVRDAAKKTLQSLSPSQKKANPKKK